MNWTGGRLHRHSHNKPSSLSRIQKQHFAKARLKLRNESHQASPLRFFTPRKPVHEVFGKLTPSADHSYAVLADGNHRTGKRRRTDDFPNTQPCQSHEKHISKRRLRSLEGLNRLQRLRDADCDQQLVSPWNSHRQTESQLPSRNQSLTYKDSPGHEVPRERPRTSSQLEDLKRQLLRQGDWTAVSAARPLRMTFASAAQREMVGKRRKITADDQRRRAAPAAKVFSPEFHTTLRKRTRRNTSSEISTLEDISIRIDGYRPNSSLRHDNQKLAYSQESSESMLLDREEAVYNNRLMDTRNQTNHRGARSLIPGRPSIASDTSPSDVRGLGHLDTHRLSSRFASSIPFSTPSRLLSTDRLTNTARSEYRNSGSPRVNYSEFLGQTQPRSSSPISHTNELPVRRRFTLDDQVLAEREGRLNISSPRLEALNIYKIKPAYIGDKTFLETRKVIKKSSPLFFAGDYSGKSIGGRRDEDTLTNIQSLSSNQHCGWLPATRRKISRDLRSTKHAGSLLRSEDIGARFEESIPRNIASIVGRQRQNMSRGSVSNADSGAKFFGQSIQPAPRPLPQDNKKLESWIGFTLTSNQGAGQGDEYQDNGQIQRLSPYRNKAALSRTDSNSIKEQDVFLGTTPTTPAPFSTQPTIQTPANTYLNLSKEPSQESSAQVNKSDTDFLSHMSLTGGFIDESLTQMSVHIDAPRTLRSLSMFSSMHYLSPVFEQRKRKHSISNQANLSSSFRVPSSTSQGYLLIQNQPSLSLSASERKTSSPDPLVMSESSFAEIQTNLVSSGGRGNRNATFGNIHADEGGQAPIFRTPFRR